MNDSALLQREGLASWASYPAVAKPRKSSRSRRALPRLVTPSAVRVETIPD